PREYFAPARKSPAGAGAPQLGGVRPSSRKPYASATVRRLETSHSLRPWLHLLGAINHPLRKYGGALRRLALGNRPVVQPSCSFTHIGIGHPVCWVAKGVLKRDEPVPTLTQHVEKLADVIRLQLIAVQEQNLLHLITCGPGGKLLAISEHSIAIRQIAADQLLHERRVAALLGIVINGRVHPVPGIQRHRSHGISARAQEGLRLAPGLQVLAGVQVGMPQVAQLQVKIGEQLLQNGFALYNIVLPGLQSYPVERSMAVCVIAQFEAVIEPDLQRLNASICFAQLVQLTGIYESDRGNLLVAQE